MSSYDDDIFDGLSGKELIFAIYKDYDENLGRRDRQGGNGIKSSAEDIYADDVHFLKELIQNADDNQYDESVVASLKFNFFEDRLEVHCNETGFNEKQIIAICSLGESTKKERKDNKENKRLLKKSFNFLNGYSQIQHNSENEFAKIDSLSWNGLTVTEKILTDSTVRVIITNGSTTPQTVFKLM